MPHPDTPASPDRDAPGAEEIARRLGAIADALAALPSGFSAERYRLLRERDAVRAQAAHLEMSSDAGRSTESLEAELASLRTNRKALAGSMGGYVIGEGGHSLGHVGAAITTLRGRSRAVPEIERLTVRITQIEDALSARAVGTAVDHPRHES